MGQSLPVVPVADVSAAVLATLLEYVYTDALGALEEDFHKEQGAEQLFDAADRYLIFPMKVLYVLLSASLSLNLGPLASPGGMI